MYTIRPEHTSETCHIKTVPVILNVFVHCVGGKWCEVYSYQITMHVVQLLEMYTHIVPMLLFSHDSLCGEYELGAL